MDDLISLSFPGPGGASVTINAPANIPHGEQYNIGNLASAALVVMLGIGIILSLIYMIYGGFFWIQTRGDKQKLDKARRIMLYSIIGLIIMSLALVIVNVIATAVGVKTVLNP